MTGLELKLQEKGGVKVYMCSNPERKLGPPLPLPEWDSICVVVSVIRIGSVDLAETGSPIRALIY
jgi:hypothetical protein